MGKINITVGKIITWVSSFLLLLGVFGDWYGDFIGDGVTIFGAWDFEFDAGFLGFFAMLIILAAEAVVFFDLFGQKKLAKYVSFGVGGTSLLVFIIALAAADGADMAYGLLLLLLGGLGMPAGPLVEDIMAGKISFGANNNGGNYSNNNNYNNVAKKFCPNCGAQVAEGAPFCTSCGNRMN